MTNLEISIREAVLSSPSTEMCVSLAKIKVSVFDYF